MRFRSAILLIPVLLWGVSYIAIKVVLQELEPVQMIAARFLMASPLLYLIARSKGLRIWPVPKQGKLFLASIIVFLHFWVMATGMKETSASNTAWILATAPIFIAILSWVYLREAFTLPQWFGLILACGGVILLTYNGEAANLSWLNSKGDIIVLGSCITWALYTVGTREITDSVDPLVATFWMTTMSGLIFVPWTWYQSGLVVYWDLSWQAAVSLVFLGVFCLAIAFWLWSEGLARQTAGEVGVYLYVEPLFTVVGAWLLLGEQLTWWLAAGAVFISLGVYVSERKSRSLVTEVGA